ncbi:GAF and ANTAR domain-containing protein [Amycolatopsis anabasis]|uniref:GAF and ANTAR domain-containing protein n=1 Tax=Amycolatopsis anabasis TaxID=1840409 RepID=UPI001C553AAF|nr:GAF and ANTAR domain-containing protein [Amycolatopsis anabasis]
MLAALRDGNDAVRPVVRVCRACAALLPVDGASISVMLGPQHRASLYASDAVVERMESVQFSLGEGPCFEAFETGQPVLVPDLARDVPLAWPMYAAQIGTEQVGAIFAFPLRRGAARFGSLNMYRRRPGWLSEAELATALQIADIATSALLAASATGPDGEISEAWLTTLTRDRAVVHQATGVLIAEFRIPPEHALARLRGHAFATGRLLDEVAADVVAGRLPLGAIDT